ncbi:MAG: hypothetical protein AABY16_01240, partial [Nanoarchaeota archaeon]
TSFPSLIFVFVIMLIFVVLSGFFSKNISSTEGVMDRFLSTSVNFEGKYVAVNEAFGMLCKDKALSKTLGITLREHFRELFSDNYAYSFVVRFNGGPGGYGYYLYSWYGAYTDRYSEDKPKVNRFEYFDIFREDVAGVKQKKFCDNFILAVKGEVIST